MTNWDDASRARPPASSGQGQVRRRIVPPPPGLGATSTAAVPRSVTPRIDPPRSGSAAADPGPARHRASGGRRRARLVLGRLDPWSVLRFSLVFSLVMLVVGIVATSLLYLLLAVFGVFSSLTSALHSLSVPDNIIAWISPQRIIGLSALIGAVNVVFFTAMATLGAFIYNICADLIGGVELTLTERE